MLGKTRVAGGRDESPAVTMISQSYDALSQRRRTNCREADRRSCERPAAVARRVEAWGCWRSGAAESRSRGWPLLRATVLPVACRRVGSMVLPPSEPIGRGDRPRERPKTAAPEAVCRAALMPRSRRCRCSPCRWRSAVAWRSRSGEGPVPARHGRSWRRRFSAPTLEWIFYNQRRELDCESSLLSSSRRISPGCTGRMPLLGTTAFSLPLAIIHDLGIMGPVGGPSETDPPLGVDADAVLPGTVPRERLQPVARQDGQVIEGELDVVDGEVMVRPAAVDDLCQRRRRADARAPSTTSSRPTDLL